MRIPWILSSLFNIFNVFNRFASLIDSSRIYSTLDIPISSHAFFFIFTYSDESGLEPTYIKPSFGGLIIVDLLSSYWIYVFNPVVISSATALPSMILDIFSI